jgi:hypothetical protein
MEKEEVLKLEYTKINDDYTIATITYQNDDILKREYFDDDKLEVMSTRQPEFEYPFLFVRGYKTELDNKPIIIPNEDLQFVKEKVKKINEKYGVVKKWYPDIDDRYYYISFGSTNSISQNFWSNTFNENQYLDKNIIFKTREEAKFVANKILENIDKWREEYQKGE